jgi:PTH1 family peptidyl-tRNA hydrolase
MKYLIAGLGNPGTKYELTRHNIGFLVLDQLADKNEATFSTERHAEVCEIKHKGRTLHLIKPNTFMNLSGKAVNYWLQELKIPVENLLVIVDDIALDHGILRMRKKGSSGGHNGLTNIEQVLATSEYTRLRFGIGNDFAKGKQADYVLTNFSQTQLDTILEPIDKACEMILSFVSIGVDKTMTQFNQ